MDKVEERLRSLIQRKRDDLAQFDQERKKLTQEITELEACLSATTEAASNGTQPKQRRVAKADRWQPWSEVEDERIVAYVASNPGVRLPVAARVLTGMIGRSPQGIQARLRTLVEAKRVRDTRKRNHMPTEPVTLEVV